jgi:hypothetical protein
MLRRPGGKSGIARKSQEAQDDDPVSKRWAKASRVLSQGIGWPNGTDPPGAHAEVRLMRPTGS